MATCDVEAIPKRIRALTETFSGYLCGKNDHGDEVKIAVYTEGRSVRLVPRGNRNDHIVHPSNAGSTEGWAHEAELVWNLTDVKFVASHSR